jgi:hypothetical protein
MSGRFTITVGERTFVCSDGRVTTELNKPDLASGTVAAVDLAERGADWAGPAQASIEVDDMMHGRVIHAQPQGGGSVVLSLRGATMLDESLPSPMVVQQIDSREIVYLAAREASFAPEKINIHGLAEAVAFEPLWVLAPVRGLSVRREVKVGVVELIDGDAGREMLRRFVPPRAGDPREPRRVTHPVACRRGPQRARGPDRGLPRRIHRLRAVRGGCSGAGGTASVR